MYLKRSIIIHRFKEKNKRLLSRKVAKEQRRNVSLNLATTIELLCFFCFASLAVPCVPCDTKNWRHKSGNAKIARNRNGRKVLLSET